MGYKVHVICAENLFSKVSIWDEMVKANPNIIVHQIASGYPSTLVEFNQGTIGKILYKILILLLPLFTKGSYLDRTAFWKKVLLKKAEKVIRENQIKHVIASGGPFGAMYYATLLKEKFGDLFLLNDMRDPWTWGPNWGFPSLSEKRMEFEKNREFVTIRDSDLISTPSEDIKNYLIEKYPKFQDKFIQIPHFFDPEEIITEKKTTSKVIRFVMYGNIYHNIESYIQKCAELFAKNKDSISLDLYTDKIQHLKTFQNAGATNVFFYEQLPAKELFSKFKNYDFVFLFNPDYNRNNISTKFYEIIQTRTPVFFFCKKGLGPDFITKNSLGLHADIENIDDQMAELINGTSTFKYNDQYDVSKFTLEKITQSISELLEINNNFLQSNHNSNKKNLLLTFDYELFLGKRSGSVYNCILLPTELILKSLLKFKLKDAIFFIDTTYLWRLSQENNALAKEDLKTLMVQLIKIVRAGHFIFPHLHPHWLDAVYLEEINEWDLSNKSKYRIQSIQPEQRKELFRYSFELIQDIQKKAGVEYSIDSYRAGGWCIQPFDQFRPQFDEFGIKNDFSILKDFSLTDKDAFYNFENFPSRFIYSFTNDIGKIESNGLYKAYSITSIHISKLTQIINKFFLKVLFKLGYNNYGDGMAARKIQHPELDETSENAYFTKKEIEMTSIELMTSVKLKIYRSFIKDNSYIHFISHPKMISSHNINCFNKFLKELLNSCEVETDYRKMH